MELIFLMMEIIRCRRSESGIPSIFKNVTKTVQKLKRYVKLFCFNFGLLSKKKTFANYSCFAEPTKHAKILPFQWARERTGLNVQTNGSLLSRVDLCVVDDLLQT